MNLMTPPAAPAGTRHRLVTRSDFDGLVCAALLKELGMPFAVRETTKGKKS